MIRTESGRMITKNIDDMTIAEYMKYEAEIRRDPWRYTRSSGVTTLGGTKSLENMHQPDKLKINDYFPLIPTCFKPAQPCTDDIHEPLGNDPNDYHLFIPQSHYDTEEISSDEDIHAMADVGDGINMMPKSLFKHLKLANLKKTSMAIEMVIDTLEEPNKTILLVRPFLATIHAQIDVFRGEISLGVGNEKVKFDMNGEICHSRVPLEIFYMVSSIQESEYFNPHEMGNDDSSTLEQRTFHYSEESVDTVDSSSDSQENEVGSHLSKNVSRWHVCKPVHITFKGHKNISDSIRSVMFKEWVNKDFNFGVNIGRTKDDPYSRNFDVYKDEFDKEIEQLVNEYELKAGRKSYALEEVWEKCENFYDSTKLWYDEGFEEEELWQLELGDWDYKPSCSLYKKVEFEVPLTHIHVVERLVPSCCVIFDLEPLSLSFDFVFTFEIFKSLSFSLDRLCHLAILCLDQHAHTLHLLESSLIISLEAWFLRSYL
ncbi:hypothetical protein Tco_1576629 [Tanacetum coccineum]